MTGNTAGRYGLDVCEAVPEQSTAFHKGKNEYRHVNNSSVPKSDVSFFYLQVYVHIVHPCVLLWPSAFIMLMVLEAGEDKSEVKSENKWKKGNLMLVKAISGK